MTIKMEKMKKLEVEKTDILVSAIENVVGKAKRPVQLHEPFFDGNESAYVQDCVKSGWVSYAGAYVDRFEKMLAEFTDARHAVVMVNGTTALFICLKLAGVRHDDEVIVPDMTFVGTVNPVIHCGAVPHFADIDSDTLTLSPSKLETHLKSIAVKKGGKAFNRKTGRRISAVVPMHTFGHPADLDHLKQICDKYRLAMVEDAAQSLGSLYNGRHTGTSGLLSALSFNGNKIVTTGGGGAILTNDSKLAALAKHLTTTAKKPHPYEFFHDMAGYNSRMPNINAALGCAQMEKIESFISRKRFLASRYAKELKGISWIRFLDEPTYARSNYWLNTIILDAENEGFRINLIDGLRNAGFMVRPAWRLMHELPMFGKFPKMDLSNAVSLQKRIISLPSSVSLA